jgi:Type I phosphodiesterase / nucleotide pyrophosphatase
MPERDAGPSEAGSGPPGTGAGPPGAPEMPVPAYGRSSVAEVMPSLLAAAGMPGEPNPLGIEPVRGFCLFVIDGLGWEQLAAHRSAAPAMTAAVDEGPAVRLDAAFPSTTAASLTSILTGVPPGRHGMVGYTVVPPAGRSVPGPAGRAMNLLRWEPYGIGPDRDLRADVVPEEYQPNPTALERAATAGFDVARVGPGSYEGSGFTRAAVRGGRYVGASAEDEMVAAVTGLLRPASRPAVYAYLPDLDLAGHGGGVGSAPWLAQLARLDALVERLASSLPPGCLLAVTGDHGMLNMPPEARLDLADHPALTEGVRGVGGEARMRHLYAAPGAEADVLATWRETVGDRMWVAARAEAVEAGWFGPVVTGQARERIGDVVAAARAPFGVFQRTVDPMHVSLAGHHGSMTDAERLVPLLLFR